MKRDNKGKFTLSGDKPKPVRGVTKIKREVTDFLKEKGIYNSTDDFLIKELVESIYIANALHKVIIQAIRNGELITEKNTLHPAIDGKKKTVGTIINLCTKLGISPQDRAKLKLNVPDDPDMDEIENFMNEAS